jgi:formylglycine-generating enzyme required for sulfatase activity
MKTYIYSILLITISLGSCAPKSEITGWDYNNPRQGGFQKIPYVAQETAIGMILIEGQELILATTPEDTTLTTISDFYISQYHETNGQYRAYLEYLQRYYSRSTHVKALPDTTVWQHEDLSQQNKVYLMNNYLRNSLFQDYPVVGVSPEQIEKYASWKTDRMNELILIREGVISYDTLMTDSSTVFSTQSYFEGHYESQQRFDEIQDLTPSNVDGKKLGTRRVRFEDAILMPRYRIPTIQEWQFAALALGDDKNKYVKTEKSSKVDKKLNHYFKSLYMKPKKINYASQQDYLPFLKPVYAFDGNNYKVHDLSSGLSEVVCDSLGNYSVGSSATNYAAIHLSKKAENINYILPGPFEKPILLTASTKRAIGFRLAMDRIGGGVHDKMRRRKGQ